MTVLEAPVASPQGLLHKNVPVTGFKVVDDEQGIVECFVSGIGNKDSAGDIIQSGAFVDSLRKRTPKGVWSHDWSIWVSKTLEVHEVSAGDPRLPMKMQQAGIGGLYVKTQFNLETQPGREAYSNVKFFGPEESEWSIGYMVVEQQYSKDLQANLLIKIDLYEYSPVLFGANPLTATVSVKVAVEDKNHIKVEVTGVDDEELATKVAGAVEAVVGQLQTETKGGEGSGTGDRGSHTHKHTHDNGDSHSHSHEHRSGNLDHDGSDTEVAHNHSHSDDNKGVEGGEQEHKVVPGSLEARYRAISQALSEKYPNAYAYPIATFNDSVVYEVMSWQSGEDEGTFRCTYEIEGDSVTLGVPEPVDVVEVVVAKAALAQAEANGVKLDEMALAAKTAFDLLEEKAGRVLSSKNLDRLNQVKSLVDEILSSADAKENNDEEKDAVAALLEEYSKGGMTVEDFQVKMAEIQAKAATSGAHAYQQGEDGTCVVCNLSEDHADANHTGDTRNGGSASDAETDASKPKKGEGDADDKSVQGEDAKKAIASHSTDTSDKTWDGAAQKKNLPNESAALRKAFAWVDPDGDADTKSSYKFIHHFVDSDGKAGAASTTACSTGIGVLNGGRGGTQIPSGDKTGVYNHLAKHLKDAGQEPPDLKTVDPDGAEHVHKFVEAGTELKTETCGEHYDVDGDVEHCGKAPGHEDEHGPAEAAEKQAEIPAEAKTHDFDSDGAVLCDTCEKAEDHWIHAKHESLAPLVEKLAPVLVALKERGEDLGEKADAIQVLTADVNTKMSDLTKQEADADVTALVQEIDEAVDDLMELLGIPDPAENDDDGSKGGQESEMVTLSPKDLLDLELLLTDEALRG